MGWLIPDVIGHPMWLYAAAASDPILTSHGCRSCQRPYGSALAAFAHQNGGDSYGCSGSDHDDPWGHLPSPFRSSEPLSEVLM